MMFGAKGKSSSMKNDFEKRLAYLEVTNTYLWHLVVGLERKLATTNQFKKEGGSMPLVKGKKASTKKGFSENVKREMESGKSQKQSVAIAYSEARRGKKAKK